MRRSIITAGLAASALLFATPARAEAPRRGITLELGFGANGLTDDDYINGDGDSIDVDPLVGLSFAALYRFMPWVSAGVVAHYGFILVDGEGWDDEYGDFLGIVGAARGHYAFGRFEPWAELGVGYAMTHIQGRGRWSFGPWAAESEGFLALHGVAFDLALGLNVFLTDSLAIGPFFRMLLGAWPTACYSIETDIPGLGSSEQDDCDDIDDVYDQEPDDLPHLWTVGIDFSATF